MTKDNENNETEGEIDSLEDLTRFERLMWYISIKFPFFFWIRELA